MWRGGTPTRMRSNAVGGGNSYFMLGVGGCNYDASTGLSIIGPRNPTIGLSIIVYEAQESIPRNEFRKPIDAQLCILLHLSPSYSFLPHFLAIRFHFSYISFYKTAADDYVSVLSLPSSHRSSLHFSSVPDP
jgi:hypothetical protein